MKHSTRIKNDNGVILPMEQPVISGYSMDANAIAIVTNHAEAISSLCNYFIQMFSYRRWEGKLEFNIAFSDSFHFYRNFPYLDVQRIKKHIVADKWGNVHSFLEESLSQGYYAYLILNRHYISAYHPPLEQNSPHDVLIYGFDRKTKKYYFADNLNYGKYGFSSCTYEELEQAFVNLNESAEHFGKFDYSIQLLSYKSHSSASFNLPKVINSLEGYVNSRPLDDRAFHPDTVYGLEVYDCYKRYITMLKKNKVRLDIRPSHNMCNHKAMMLLRIQYMIDNQIVTNTKDLLEGYKEIEHSSLFIRNMLLKFAISKDESILERICPLLDKTKQQEERVLERLLNILHTKIS